MSCFRFNKNVLICFFVCAFVFTSNQAHAGRNSRCSRSCTYAITKNDVKYSVTGTAVFYCRIGWPSNGCAIIQSEIIPRLSPTSLSGSWNLGCGNNHSYSASIIAPPPPPPTNTPTPTKTATPTATSTPTPKVTPSVDPGGPYTNIACVPGTTQVQLKGTLKGALSRIKWTSNCPDAVITNADKLNATLEFTSAKVSGSTALPSTCSVTLSTTDNASFSASSTVQVAVNACAVDCKGQINGQAKTDRCGVCEGNGQSCISCNSVDIAGLQFELDQFGVKQRNYVLDANRIIKKAYNSNVPANIQTKAAQFVERANQLHVANWSAAYTIPNVIIKCEISPYCEQFSLKDFKANYALNAKEFGEVLKKMKRLLPSNDEDSKEKMDRLIIKSRQIEKDASVSLTALPESHSSCS